MELRLFCVFLLGLAVYGRTSSGNSELRTQNSELRAGFAGVHARVSGPIELGHRLDKDSEAKNSKEFAAISHGTDGLLHLKWW